MFSFGKIQLVISDVRDSVLLKTETSLLNYYKCSSIPQGSVVVLYKVRTSWKLVSIEFCNLPKSDMVTSKSEKGSKVQHKKTYLRIPVTVGSTFQKSLANFIFLNPILQCNLVQFNFRGHNFNRLLRFEFFANPQMCPLHPPFGSS